uniref:Cadherin-like and PC-esterase domain containing 1 n=1 Tax=Hucho hucho TaxID=62062 RepID=A0A4W5K8W0_9TELE
SILSLSLWYVSERCVDPHLRQLYTDPHLTLSPPFSPWVKDYRAEVPFDVVTLRLRPEPISPACHIHLDEHRGPRTANYPVGLGNSIINILVTDESAATEPEPVVMTIYTLHMYRESRPSLPMFGEHVMCGFVQIFFTWQQDSPVRFKKRDGGKDERRLRFISSITAVGPWPQAAPSDPRASVFVACTLCTGTNKKIPVKLS